MGIRAGWQGGTYDRRQRPAGPAEVPARDRRLGHHPPRTLLLACVAALSLCACAARGSRAGCGTPHAAARDAGRAHAPRAGSTITLGEALVVPGAATGKTYYVATFGSDRNSGSSPQAPFKSIQHAIETVGPGGTIKIMGGTYRGGIVIDHPGTSRAWITMEPYGNEKVVLDGRGTTDDVFFYNNTAAPTYWVVKGLTIRHARGYTVQISVPDVKLIDNDISESHNDLVKLVQQAHNIVIWGNDIHDNDARPGANAQGVDMVGSQNVLVAHNTVSDIASIGLYCKGNAGDITFEDNDLNNIYSRGIMLGESTGLEFLLPGKTYESYNSIIKNNVITNDQSACLAEASSYNAQIYDNSCYNTAISRHGAIMISNESKLHQAGKDVYVRNNVIYDLTDRPMEVIAPQAMAAYCTLHIDHNMYYDPKGVTFEWDDKGIYGMHFAAWQRTTGFDRHSVVANPLFANFTSLTLKAASPAVGAGVALPDVRHDFNGLARPAQGSCNEGAYQSIQ